MQGGAPDLSDTARSIARDWNQGRLPFFAVPPTSSTPSTTPASSKPALDACLSLKEIRAAPRAWPVQLDAGTPDERDVALDAAFVVEKVERPAREEMMEVDGEDEDGDEEDELESGSEDEDEDEEMESGSEDEDEDEDESEEEEDIPTPVLKRKSKALPTHPPKKVSFATKHQPPSEPRPKSNTAPKPATKSKSKPVPAPVPQRIGNVRAGGKKQKAQVVSVNGEESYDFSQFF